MCIRDRESTIDELNYLGKLLEMQGDEDRNKFTAAVTLGEHAGSVNCLLYTSVPLLANLFS